MGFFAGTFTRCIPLMLLVVFFVVACGGGGSGGSGAPAVVAPGIPTGVTASASGNTRVDLVWATVSGATGYNVYRSTTMGVAATVANKISPTPVGSSTFRNTGLLAETSYYYIVTAVNAAGESMGSLEVGVTTKATPNVPEELTATAIGGDKRIDLAWAEVSGASGYNVYRATTPKVVISEQTKVTFKPLTAAALTNTDLEAATPYFYRVTAINAKGESAGSAEVTATTAALSWTTTGSMAVARYGHTATLLANGKVLVIGGFDAAGQGLTSGELYDPATGVWSQIKPPFFERGAHTTTLLPNGKLLIAGGFKQRFNPTGTMIGTTEIYDPVADTWATIGVLSRGRQSHSATLLPNGKVLVAGGYDVDVHTTSEVFDPAAGKWSPTGALNKGHTQHSATLLANGQVLITGGYGPSLRAAISELYDPAAGTWMPTANLVEMRVSHAASVLPNGKVLVTGGTDSIFFSTLLASSELYDPSKGTWEYGGRFAIPRHYHTSTVLASGNALVAGGYSGASIPIEHSTLYNPTKKAWTNTGSLMVARYVHTATLLQNGKLLVTGGKGASGPLASSELYW